MTSTSPVPTTTSEPGGDAPATPPAERSPGIGSKVLRAVLTQREMLLAVLLVITVGTFLYLSWAGYLTANYDRSYMASALIDLVPLAMLALAELVVIVSGRGGIDLSVGSIVSLTAMVFGFAYGQWGWSLLASVVLALVVGALLGAVNGVLVAYLGFPALIATLATYYAYASLAVVINDQKPISGGDIAAMYSLTRSVEIPGLSGVVPPVPLGVFTFLLPTVVVVWLVVNRLTYGRRLFAIGTNDVAGTFSGVHVARTRLLAYVAAGALSGLVAVYLTAQFASARPDAGTSGNGLALPAITIAVLGGVAITGGIGRVSGVVLAALLVTWLNAGILLYFEGNQGTQFQLLALGAVLVFAALLNSWTVRRYGGTR
ncbi:erythritol transport system permease protein [Nocardioides scoriae]|uniref:Autoinducer 2 import system permease protein LsrD n=1 Tax=Nocardioides scoriae TaxID=642780 RepID=A0A1H1RW40_9ACTN|nr:ABC transporter permease [Nocardioides scoriae]SDS39895.1 erythritol transport system permease protein [Nocardioides scoriae]